MRDLRWFNKLYSVKFLRRLTEGAGEDLSRVAYYLTDTSAGAEIRRVELDKYLEVAYRHNAMSQDRAHRLRSRDWKVFIQALQEIKAAWYFEHKLGFAIKLDPEGRGTSVGDFELIRKSGPPIFVEVKSPIRERKVRVWSGNDSAAIRSNVKRAMTQLPEDRPAIVALCGILRTPLSDPQTGIIDALYGTTVLRVPLGKEKGEPAQVSLEPNGLYQPKTSTRISAVVTLEDVIYSPYLDNLMAHVLSRGKVEVDESLPGEILRYNYKVYHNPYGRHPLDKSTFGSAKQFAPSAHGHMQWYPK